MGSLPLDLQSRFSNPGLLLLARNEAYIKCYLTPPQVNRFLRLIRRYSAPTLHIRTRGRVRGRRRRGYVALLLSSSLVREFAREFARDLRSSRRTGNICPLYQPTVRFTFIVDEIYRVEPCEFVIVIVIVRNNRHSYYCRLTVIRVECNCVSLYIQRRYISIHIYIVEVDGNSRTCDRIVQIQFYLIPNLYIVHSKENMLSL